jgi:hypothetical protein
VSHTTKVTVHLARAGADHAGNGARPLSDRALRRLDGARSLPLRHNGEQVGTVALAKRAGEDVTGTAELTPAGKQALEEGHRYPLALVDLGGRIMAVALRDKPAFEGQRPIATRGDRGLRDRALDHRPPESQAQLDAWTRAHRVKLKGRGLRGRRLTRALIEQRRAWIRAGWGAGTLPGSIQPCAYR